MEVDTNIYVQVLREQRNQALDAAALLQAELIKTQKELEELKRVE